VGYIRFWQRDPFSGVAQKSAGASISDAPPGFQRSIEIQPNLPEQAVGDGAISNAFGVARRRSRPDKAVLEASFGQINIPWKQRARRPRSGCTPIQLQPSVRTVSATAAKNAPRTPNATCGLSQSRGRAPRTRRPGSCPVCTSSCSVSTPSTKTWRYPCARCIKRRPPAGRS
jgi:hypothetical protein